MKRKTLLIAIIGALSLVASAAYAADSDTDSGVKSSNAATPATPSSGQGQAATPAMPGNPTAQQKVMANRAKEEQLRLAAAKRAAAAKQHRDTGLGHASVERPTVSRPEITRPDIVRPEINR